MQTRGVSWISVCIVCTATYIALVGVSLQAQEKELNIDLVSRAWTRLEARFNTVVCDWVDHITVPKETRRVRLKPALFRESRTRDPQKVERVAEQRITADLNYFYCDSFSQEGIIPPFYLTMEGQERRDKDVSARHTRGPGFVG